MAAELYITVLGVLPSPAAAGSGVCNQLRRLSFSKNARGQAIPTSVCAAGRGHSQDFVVAWGPVKGGNAGGYIEMFATQSLARGTERCAQLHGTFAESLDVESTNGSWQIVARAHNGGVYLVTDNGTFSPYIYTPSTYSIDILCNLQKLLILICVQNFAWECARS